MKNLINFKNFETSEIAEIVERALEIKSVPSAYKTVLSGKKMYMLFQKTSTRTALSFAAGITDLGGTYFLQNWNDSNFSVGETIDEVRYLGRNVDLIMARLKSHDDIAEFAKYSTVPVINGCCNRYHPCQALGDMLTIKELFGSFSVKLLYIGIWNNVLNSLAETLPFLGGELYVLTPIINEPSIDGEVRQKAIETGKFHELEADMETPKLKEIISEMDIIYTDTWVDMESFNDDSFKAQKDYRIGIMSPFQINLELLNGSKAVVMHDMPIHPGYEITRRAVEKNIEVILRQAENRRHAQNAAMLKLLGIL